MFLQLSKQEVDDNRFIRTGGAANEGVAQIAKVKIEIVGRSGRCFQKRNRWSPLIAINLTKGERETKLRLVIAPERARYS